MALHAPHDIFELVLIATNDQVHMAWHDCLAVDISSPLWCWQYFQPSIMIFSILLV
jgi:hypothetical protein